MNARLITTILAFSLYGPLCAQMDFNPNLSSLGQPEGAAAIPAPAASMVEEGSGSCATYSTAVKLRGKTVQLPATGIWTLESHLATTEDAFPSGRSFPRSVKENIQKHLDRALEKIAKFVPVGKDPGGIYRNRWEKEWTPAEGGKAGQGSVGKKPSPEEEMWLFNMLWARGAIPKPGTKFLASFNGKNVVVVGGYETGPSVRKFIGGFQKEVFFVLGAEEGKSKITLSALKNQDLHPGPIKCQ